MPAHCTSRLHHQPWAAVELRTDRTVADPFRPSADIAAFARARAGLRIAA